jgi:hypothetical protein
MTSASFENLKLKDNNKNINGSTKITEMWKLTILASKED